MKPHIKSNIQALIIAAGFISIGFIHYNYTQSKKPVDIITKEIELAEREVKPVNDIITKITSPPEVKTTPIPINSVISTPAPIKYFADNQYVLIVYKSVETSDGIKGFKPGTVLIKTDDKYKSDDGTLLDLNSNEVTNNPDIAVKYISADRAAQFNIKTKLAELATPVPVPQATPIATPRPVVNNITNNPLNQGAYNKRDSKTGVHTDEQGKEYIVENGKRIYLK